LGYHRREHLVDTDGGQACIGLRAVADEIVDPDDVDRGDLRVHPALAGECDDRVDLTQDRGADLWIDGGRTNR